MLSVGSTGRKRAKQADSGPLIGAALGPECRLRSIDEIVARFALASGDGMTGET